MKYIIFFLVFFLTLTVKAQVGIGTTSPNSSSMLEVKSSQAGILIPRMTTAQRTAIGSPAQSLLVYDTDVEMYYYFSSANTAWVAINVGSVKTISATAYTLVPSDSGRILDFTSATSVTLTVPNSLPIGFQTSITQVGVGIISVVGSGGMVINNRWAGTATSGQWAKIGLEVRATNSCVMSGDVR
jgi:hypothetical protein